MNRISTISQLAIVFVILFSFETKAQIAGWFFKDKDGSGNYTINTNGNEITRAADLVHSNLASAPVLSRGSGMSTTTNNTRTFNGIVNLTPADATGGLTLAEAVTGNAYYEFTLLPASTKTISIGKIQFRFRRGGATSPDKVQFRYFLGPVAAVPTNNDFVNLGTAVTSTGTITDGVDQEITGINSIVALQNVGSTQKIVIRAYWYGSTSTTTSAVAFGKSINNSGTVAEYGALSVIDASTLPVQLTSFTAKAKTSTVELSWSTAAEQNNAYFEILRSANGQPNTLVGKVAGKGNTSTESNYRFVDYSPLSTAYYQLRQVDVNGDSQLSDIVVVNGSFSNSTLQASAANGKFSASYQSDKAQQAKLSIIDINGKLLVERSISLEKGINQIQLPLNANSGLYLAKLQKDDGSAKGAKFIYQ